MSEAARIFFEVLRLGRSQGALLARAAFAEHRGLVLEEKAKRATKDRRKRSLYRRGLWWKDRAKALKYRAEEAR